MQNPRIRNRENSKDSKIQNIKKQCRAINPKKMSPSLLYRCLVRIPTRFTLKDKHVENLEHAVDLIFSKNASNRVYHELQSLKTRLKFYNSPDSN